MARSRHTTATTLTTIARHSSTRPARSIRPTTRRTGCSRTAARAIVHCQWRTRVQDRSTGTTTTTYDVFGNLLHVGLPNGTAIDYVVDGENRRVGKKVNSTLTSGFLYQDALNVVVQLDGSGNVVARFVFGSKPNVPDYFATPAGPSAS